MGDDRRWYENSATAEQRRMFARFHSAGSELDRKFWVALALYVVLAALAWFTLGEGKILVAGRPVELRLLPLVVLGGFALRTVLARQAEKIRRGGE
ncbi:MAG: hypothetical protein ABSC76_19600 [Terracidiphilus sp.]